MNPFDEILNKLETIDTELNNQKDSEIKEYYQILFLY